MWWPWHAFGAFAVGASAIVALATGVFAVGASP
jgi:hypothetical protein